MRPKRIFISPDATDADGIKTIAAIGGAGALTLNGALVTSSVAYMDYARQIGILSAGNDTGITFTIVGTDADGRAQTEAVTGASGGTAESTGYFLTVTSITASGASAGNVTIGVVDEFITNTIPLNHYASDPPTVSIEGISGTVNVSVQETFSRVQDTAVDINWSAGPSALTGITADAAADMSNHITGVRFVCNSFTNGASLYMVVNQNRC